MLNGSSSKFTFGGGSDPYKVILLEYVDGVSGGTDGGYSMTIALAMTASSSNFQVRFATSNRILITSVRVTILFVAQAIGSNKIGFFNSSATTGAAFTTDFGVSVTNFGYPSPGVYCIFGVTSLDLILNKATPLQTEFSFTITGLSITGLTSTSLNSVTVLATCFGVCPSGKSFVSGACVTGCPTACTTCSSATVCTQCASGFYLRSDSLCYTGCLAGTWPNSTALTCDACTTGCKTCTSASACSVS
jgi:hypothetical protein